MIFLGLQTKLVKKKLCPRALETAKLVLLAHALENI